MRQTVMAILVSVAVATSSYGFSVGGVEFTDYLLLDVAPGSNLQLSSTGDIYVWVPGMGLTASSVDFRALEQIVLNVPLNAGQLSLATGPFANIDDPPTVLQDVVLRFSGDVGALNLDSSRSIVVDSVAIPEPSALILAALMCCLLIARARGKRQAGG